ncbi:MAG TPA: hydrogenase 3 maturation endopeptidase HyCI [Anaerolineales bacterium]|nr:hydrogenase 3 maturation endopeptidase HyCI [Anaerolineales bacterium]
MPNTWRTSLHPLLQQLTNEVGKFPRVAIAGIGNNLRSDDAAGMLIARALSERKCAADTDHLLILEAGYAPENHTGELRTFAPSLVLLIDAADMGKDPGTVAWISEEDIDGMSASTHSLPLSMLTKYLSLELGCKVMLLGLQAVSNEVGETVSAEVLQAVEEVVNGLDETLRRSARV